MTRKIAFITGATSGIGWATALKLAENKYDIIATGRRKERLESLQQIIEIQTSANIICLNFDARQAEQVEKQINSLPEKWKNIDVLINNAGLAAGLDSIQDGEIDNWERMIDTNIKALLYVSRQISPLMIKRQKGHIINITSIAGKEVYPNGAVYCATKHAADALTKGMRIDMLEQGIKVTAIAPGMVDTEFSLVRLEDAEAAKKVYEGLSPLYANDIAEAVLFAVTRPAHVNINDMLIMPTAQANAYLKVKV